MCDRQLFDPRLTVRATDEGQRWNVVHCSTNLVVGMGQSLERGTRHILIPQLGRLPGVKYRDVPVVVAAVSIKDRVPVGVYWHPVTNGDSAPHAWAVGFPCMGHPVKKNAPNRQQDVPFLQILIDLSLWFARSTIAAPAPIGATNRPVRGVCRGREECIILCQLSSPVSRALPRCNQKAQPP